MGSEVTEAGDPLTTSSSSSSAVPQLSLFSASPIMSIKSPSSEPSGMLTPPLQGAGAAVPFRWEEEPGKPRACTCTHLNTHSQAQLELPPRLFLQYQGSVKLTSPTTVLEGPYIKKRPKASSFRMATSFTPSPDRSINVLSNRWHWQKHRQSRKEKAWLFGGWKTKLEFKTKIRSEAAAWYKDSDDDNDDEEEYWISSSTNKNKFIRTGSFALLSQSQTKSQFWASIYGGLKQMIPWKAKKLKKTGIAK